MGIENNNRGNNRPEKRLTREEQIRIRKRINSRNENVRRGKRSIPLNDSRRRVEGNLTEEEIIQREIQRQRRLYRESLRDQNEELNLENNYENRNSNKNNSSNIRRENIRRRESNKKDSKREGFKRKESRIEKNNCKKNKKKKRVSIKKIIQLIAAILVFAVLFTGFNIGNTVSKISNSGMIEPKVVSMNSTVNILLLGMDVGNIKDPKDSSAKRTDTIMVLNFNPKSKEVRVVSIPRDTMIDIKGRTWKINAAYPVGGEKEIVNQVEKLLDIDINYVANINYNAFRDFIDAIGGVTVNIKHNMDYTDKSQNLRIKFKKGTNEHLNGKKAEEFFRWRKNNDGTGLAMGDLGRIENQHEFMEAVVKKCTNPTIVFRLPSILKSIEKNVSTNMPGSTMAKYALKLMTVKSENFKMLTVKGTPEMIGGQSYFIFDKEKNKNLIQSLKDGTTSAIKKSGKGEVSVMILNSTNITGLAARYKSTLDREGFKSIDIGTIENETAKKSYAMVKNKEIEKIVKPELVGIDEYKTMKSDSEYSKYDLVIVLGLDSE